MSRPTRPEDTDQEAHNRGGLEDNYRSNLVNRASRDRVWVKYNDNWIFHVKHNSPPAYKGGVEEVSTQAIIIQLMHSGRKFFILTDT
jgi:hypothetical protein